MMRRKFIWLSCMIVFFSILLVGCLDKDKKVDSYSDFLHGVQYFKDEIKVDQFKSLTTSEKLAKQFTSFPDYQKLDTRSFDGVEGNTKKPSRYQFFFLNDNESILVRVNLIYASEYKTTKIISLIDYDSANIDELSPYKNELPLSYSSYLIAYKNGLAAVDFFNTTKSKHMNNRIVEGEDKFIPAFQKVLTEISND